MLLFVVATLAVWVAVVAFAQARADLSQPGPFFAGERSVTVRRQDNSTFTAVLYYPATAAGANTPVDPRGPYPAITFGHGFLQPVDRYQSTLRHLATHGYLVIATTSEGGLFPNHANFARDMRLCLTWLEEQSTTPGGFLQGLVRTDRFGASGHSMGGGASILAAADDPRIKALANLAAADTNPSSITAMTRVNVPVSLVSGSQDTIVPPGTNGQRMYDNARAPRVLPIIQGGWHCGFQDVSVFGCDSGSLSRPNQLAETRRLLTSFFNLFLKADQSDWSLVWGPLMRDNPLTRTTFDPGATVTPDRVTRTIPRGQRTTYEVVVRNTTSVSTSFTVLVSDNRWPMLLLNPVTPVLPPGGEATVRVAFTGFTPGSGANSDTTTLSLRSDRDGLTRAFATLTTVLQ